MTGSRTRALGLLAVAFAVAGTLAGAQSPTPAAPATSPTPAGARGQQAPTPPATAGVGCPELTNQLREPAAAAVMCRGGVLVIESGNGLVRYTDSRLLDWAQLGRYRDANRSLGSVDVVFMGDSITDSWPQERFGPFFPGKNYVGRGISGQTTPQMLIRFRPDVLNLKPKAVVILAGTNDIAGNTGPMTDEDIQNNLISMSELAKTAGVKVVLSSITPTSAYHVGPTGIPQTTTRPLPRIRALNEWMKSYAASAGHVYLDYFSAMIDTTGAMKSEYTNDDLHPNAAGYAVMAPLAQQAIDRALR